LVRCLAGALGTSRRASPAFSTALAVERSTAAVGGRRLLRVARLLRVVGATTAPHSRTRHSVRSRVASPFVIGQARIVRLVHAGDLDQRAWVASAGSLNFELSTLHVMLALGHMHLVNCNVLDAYEILPGGDILGDGEGDSIFLPRAPASVVVGLAAAKTGLVDLEPVTRAVVGVDGAGGLGHVYEARAGVLNELVVPELEANLVAGLDGHGLGASGLGTRVATEVVRGDNIVGERGHVAVAVLADVGVVTTLGLAVDKQLAEDVVGLDGKRRSQKAESKGGLHLDEFREVQTNADLVARA
jgi:hypothetical protein